MDRGAWRATVHGFVKQLDTTLNNDSSFWGSGIQEGLAWWFWLRVSLGVFFKLSAGVAVPEDLTRVKVQLPVSHARLLAGSFRSSPEAVQYRSSLVTQDREHGRNIFQWLLWFSLRTTLHHLHLSLFLRIKSLTYVLSCSVVSSSCDSIDCSPAGSSVHGILQARMVEWVAISFSRGSSWPRDRTQVSCIAGRLFTDWVMGEGQSNHYVQLTQGEGKLHLLKGRVSKNVWTCFLNNQSRKVECLVIFVIWAMFLVCVHIYACVHLLEWLGFVTLFIL